MSTAKKAAAEKAVESIEPGMTVGLGTGTTALFAIEALGQKVREGLTIKAVASSVASEGEAKKAGIRIVSFDALQAIDVYIDGADEVDEQKNLIKGGGGALLREKILAHNSKRFIVIVDERKLVKRLGRFPLPVEIVQFAAHLTAANVAKLAGSPQWRTREGRPFVTDNGNYILDCPLKQIENPAELSERFRAIPGVVEIGLFANAMVNEVIVGDNNGATRIL